MPNFQKKTDKLSQVEKKKKSISMHEDVPVWYDCCSCEAEPYWEEAMQKQDNDDKGKESRD